MRTILIELAGWVSADGLPALAQGLLAGWVAAASQAVDDQAGVGGEGGHQVAVAIGFRCQTIGHQWCGGDGHTAEAADPLQRR